MGERRIGHWKWKRLSIKWAVLTHSIGKRKESETVLTTREFCSRLTAIRQRLKEEQKKELENANDLNF